MFPQHCFFPPRTTIYFYQPWNSYKCLTYANLAVNRSSIRRARMCRFCYDHFEQLPRPAAPSSPKRPDIFMTDEQQSAVVANQRELRNEIDNLLAILGPLVSSNEQCQPSISNIKYRLSHVDDLLSQTLSTKAFNAQLQPGSSAARRTFDVPELLELILLNLGLPDLLQVSQVNCTMRDGIAGSIKLQQKLCFYPKPHPAHYYNPFDTACPGAMAGFICSADSSSQGSIQVIHEPNKNGQWLQLQARFELLPRQTLAKITPRQREMLICQPPVPEATAYIRCCPHPLEDQPPAPGQSYPPLKITRETGITIGDLYDLAEKIIDKHRYCPRAQWRCLDEDGTVNAELLFKLSVPLHDDDPMVKLWEQQQKSRTLRTKKR
jgi:hypothetical protein